MEMPAPRTRRSEARVMIDIGEDIIVVYDAVWYVLACSNDLAEGSVELGSSSFCFVILLLLAELRCLEVVKIV